MATIAEKLAEAAVTDSLLRNENPLSNASAWHKPSWCNSISQTNSSTGWQVGTAFTTGPDGARFDDISFLQKVSGSVYTYSIGTVTLSNNNTAERWYGLWGLQHASERSGYFLKAEVTGSGKYKLSIEKVTKGSYESLASTSNYSLSTTSGTEVATFAIVVGGGKVYFYIKKPAGSWEQVLEATDSTYTEGYGCMEGRGNFMRLKNWRVGTFTLAEPKAPVVTTDPADNIGPSKAELHGEVDPEGEKAEWWFEYGPTESYGFQAPLVPPKTASPETPEAVETQLSGLTPATKYHFRVVAKNGKGETKGADQEFETAAANTVGAKVGGVVVPAVRYVKVNGEVVPA